MWETLAAINLPPTKLWDGFYIDDWGMVSDWVYLMTLTYVNQYVYIYIVLVGIIWTHTQMVFLDAKFGVVPYCVAVVLSTFSGSQLSVHYPCTHSMQRYNFEDAGPKFML